MRSPPKRPLEYPVEVSGTEPHHSPQVDHPELRIQMGIYKFAQLTFLPASQDTQAAI